MSERLNGPGPHDTSAPESDVQRLMLEISGGNDTTPDACASPDGGDCFRERGGNSAGFTSGQSPSETENIPPPKPPPPPPVPSIGAVGSPWRTLRMRSAMASWFSRV